MSPGLSKNAPTTGTKVIETTSEAINAKVTAIQKGMKNSPTRPWMKASGAKTTMLVSVEDVMGAITSLVAL